MIASLLVNGSVDHHATVAYRSNIDCFFDCFLISSDTLYKLCDFVISVDGNDYECLIEKCYCVNERFTYEFITKKQLDVISSYSKEFTGEATIEEFVSNVGFTMEGDIGSTSFWSVPSVKCINVMNAIVNYGVVSSGGALTTRLTIDGTINVRDILYHYNVDTPAELQKVNDLNVSYDLTNQLALTQNFIINDYNRDLSLRDSLQIGNREITTTISTATLSEYTFALLCAKYKNAAGRRHMRACTINFSSYDYFDVNTVVLVSGVVAVIVSVEMELTMFEGAINSPINYVAVCPSLEQKS